MMVKNGPLLSRIVRLYSSHAAAESATPTISSTLILSRPPVITHEASAFETQFYKYQSELWRRLMWTFPKWFYFKTGTLAEQRYKVINKNPVSDDRKVLFPRGRPDLRHSRDRRFREYIRAPKTYKEEDELVGIDQSEQKESELTKKIVPNSRTTEADRLNDTTSLERQLSRTLFLAVQRKGETSWKLPSFKEQPGELIPLHLLAEQGLRSIGGSAINYFNVAKTPCHHEGDAKSREYFIKSHILSGVFEPQSEDIKFQWLTKQELKDSLPKEYYERVSHLFNDV
ncbi:mitochondrial 54S ribosomal protein mL46 [Lodderomyces beijingensis]|uniref:Large ribosomal subunit protein mL46 n=1 Tax=Lodderomyces beijingensis TaxID=1775926 RepID=A0ABP0ZTI0_9ASCO